MTFAAGLLLCDICYEWDYTFQRERVCVCVRERERERETLGVRLWEGESVLTTSVTRFGNFWPICKNVIFLGNFWRVYLVFTEIINSIWQCFYAFRQFFTVVNDQILKNNLASGHAAVTTHARNVQVRGRERTCERDISHWASSWSRHRYYTCISYQLELISHCFASRWEHNEWGWRERKRERGG